MAKVIRFFVIALITLLASQAWLFASDDLRTDDFLKLSEKLRSGTVDERRTAVSRLYVHGEKGYNLLIDVGIKDGDPTVRRNAILSLSKIGNPEAAKFIEPFLSADDEKTVLTAGTALLNLGDKGGLAPIKGKPTAYWEGKVASRDDDYLTCYRAYAAQALTGGKDLSVQKEAVDLFHQSADDYVKNQVKVAITRIGLLEGAEAQKTKAHEVKKRRQEKFEADVRAVASKGPDHEKILKLLGMAGPVSILNTIMWAFYEYQRNPEHKGYPPESSLLTYSDLIGLLSLESKLPSSLADAGLDPSFGVKYRSDQKSFSLMLKADMKPEVSFLISPQGYQLDPEGLGSDLPEGLRNSVRQLASRDKIQNRQGAEYLLSNNADARAALPILFALMAMRSHQADVSEVIAKVGGYDYVSILVLMALNEEAYGRPESEQAVEAIRKIEDPRVQEKAMVLLRSDDLGEVYLGGKILSRKKIDGKEVIGIVKEKLGGKALQDLKAENEKRAIYFLTFIALLQKPGNDPSLIYEELYQSGSEGEKFIGAYSLSGMRNRGALPYLIEMLADEKPEIRYLGANGLEQLADEVRMPLEEMQPAIMPLINALRDEDRKVRIGSAEALGRMGDPKAVIPLYEAMADPDPGVGLMAAQAFAWYRGAVPDEIFEKAMSDPRVQVRRVATQKMGERNTVRTVELLLAALGDEDKEVRISAVRCLSENNSPKVVERLKELSESDPDQDVRKMAGNIVAKHIKQGASSSTQGPSGGRGIKPDLPEGLPSQIVREINYLQSGDPRDRVVACFRIHTIGPGAAAAVPFLIPLLGDNSNVTVPIPAAVLRQLGDSEQFEPFQDFSFGVRFMTVSEAAAIALGGIGLQAADPLKAGLVGDDEKIRGGAAEALGRLRAPGTLELLVGGFESEKGPLKWKYLKGLGFLGDPGALSKLRVYTESAEPVVRVNAAWAMGRIGDPGARPSLIALLGDKEDYVRRKAEESLLLIGDDRSDGDMVTGFQSDDWRMRYYSLLVMSERQDPETIALIRKALKDDRMEIKVMALRISAKLKSGELADDLFDITRDPNEQVRYMAVENLAMMGDARAAGPMIAYLKNENLRKGFLSIVETVCQIRDPRAEEDFNNAFNSEDPLISVAGALGLSNLGNQKGTEAVISAMKTGSDIVRKAAILGGGLIGAPAVLQPLAECLRDSNVQIRALAARVLGQRKYSQAVELLIQSLDDRETSVGEVAAGALGSIGTKEASDALVDSLQRTSGRVQMSVIQSLMELQNPKVVEPLIEILALTSTKIDDPANTVVNIIITLSKLKDPRAIAPLIDALKTAPNYMKTVPANALGQLTGQDFGIDHARWQEWWESNKGDLLNKPVN